MQASSPTPIVMPDGQPGPERMLRTTTVMACLDVSRSTVERLHRSGILPGTKVGGSLRFRVTDVHHLMAQGCPAPPSRPSADAT